MAIKLKDSGFAALEAVLAVVILVAIVAIGWYVHESLNGTSSTYSSTTKLNNNTAPKFNKIKEKNQTSTTSSNPYAGWKSYTSTVEKITFKYPSDWTVDTKDTWAPNDPSNTDFIALKSPDDEVVVHWTSELDGFGNESGAAYPLNDVVSKTTMPNAPGDFVISGTTTVDGKNYYPWIAVEGANSGVLENGVGGNLDLFQGVNNTNKSTGKPDTALFSTCGPRTSEGCPSFTKADAIAFLSNNNMKTANLILLSMSY